IPWAETKGERPGMIDALLRRGQRRGGSSRAESARGAPEGMAMLRTAIIIGSVRPGRKAESVARWIYEVASKRSDSEFELVDLQSFGLPFTEEPGQPRPKAARPPATLAWAETIDSFDAFIFVTPEYNDGTSTALRSAIDLLTR